MMQRQATGEFDVKLEPQGPDWPDQDASLGRLLLDKRFRGELDAISRGQMLSAGGAAKGSAGYVAIERVSGTLCGRRGAFTLQHNATMDRGVPQLNIVVVPDSGADELAGLSGTMGIRIENGKHYYDFDYTLPDEPGG